MKVISKQILYVTALKYQLCDKSHQSSSFLHFTLWPGLQELTLRLGYYMRWPEHRMVLNDSADWSRGEINVNPDMIKNFWIPDILIHDLVR